MQFRKVKDKNVIQVLVYDGYDKVAKRSKVKMIGSFDTSVYEYSDTLKLAITEHPEYKSEIENYIAALKVDYDAEKINRRIMFGAMSITELSVAIGALGTLTDAQQKDAEAIWPAMDLLKKSLKKAGIKPPAKEIKEPAKDERQRDLPDT